MRFLLNPRDFKLIRIFRPASVSVSESHSTPRDSSQAIIFNDLVSNYTSTALTSIGVSGRRSGISTYFEGNNIIVYIRGTEDEKGEWWKQAHTHEKKGAHGKGGVMVNAHFDSVSTGYGATDDGMGVITALQLIQYFSTPGNTPKKGVIVLLNNGEEDGLYGAKAFLSHPMASFVHTFLNLEGAGAGGRATLFRSTDTQVTRAYAKAPNPFGSVISADGFALGFVRSETDYVVFRAEGYRGLDVAFWKPRARYHTEEDDARHASKESLWHMLSASVETIKFLTSDMSTKFNGKRGDDDETKVPNGQGSNGVWFDLFGKALVVLELRTMFAISLALLVAGPLLMWLACFLLLQQNKFYFFKGSVTPHNQNHENETISLKGGRGFFRYPFALVLSAASTVGAALLLGKINPLIIYSSQYAVWSMFLCLFFCVFWSFTAIADFFRPSALTRAYSLLWSQAVVFLILVAATVLADRYSISGGYMFVFYYAAVLIAGLISLLELLALPSVEHAVQSLHAGYEGQDVDETTPLLGANVPCSPRDLPLSRENSRPLNVPHDVRHLLPPRTLGLFSPSRFASSRFASYRRLRRDDSVDSGHHSAHYCGLEEPHHREQKWSGALPSWTWVLQFLVVAPFMLVILGQVGLLLVTATAQTGTDGSPLLLPYLIIAMFTVLLLLPIGPFMHRIHGALPIFLGLVFIATLAYNLLAFPFSGQNRYKAYFQQTVDLDSGTNTVSLVGVEKYIREIISAIPSATGQIISCTERPQIRSGLSFCTYTGIPPRVLGDAHDGIPPEISYPTWLTYTATRVPGQNKATFHISGKETRACVLRFDEPFSAFSVRGAASSDGNRGDNGVPKTGSDQIKLWHREWNKEWVVDVEWEVGEGMSPGEEGRNGRVVCLWSDHNNEESIPALNELQRFAPEWTSVVKLMDGLVEGSKAFVV